MIDPPEEVILSHPAPAFEQPFTDTDGWNPTSDVGTWHLATHWRLATNEEAIPLPRTPWAALCAQYGLDPNLPGLTGFRLYGGFSNRLLARIERAANGADYEFAYTELGVRLLSPHPPFKRIRGPKRRSSRRLSVQRKRAAQGLPPDGKIPTWTRKQTRIVAGVVPAEDIRFHIAYQRAQQEMRRSIRRLEKLDRALKKRRTQSLCLCMPRLRYDIPPYQFRKITAYDHIAS